MGFQQALSGLNVSSKALDVVSNNVANASTVGFKTASAHFADLFAVSLSGLGSPQIGMGASVAAVQQEFNQGNVTTTNNPLDIAINGSGFFRMTQNGSVSYSRNGQFHLDKSGYIVNDQGMNLTGYAADPTGLIIPSTPSPLQISAADIAPVATGSGTGSFQGVKANLNLDSGSKLTTAPWVDGNATGSWSPNANTYNFTTGLSVYDTLGNPHKLTMYFAKDNLPPTVPPTTTWSVYANVDGTTNQHMLDASGNPIAGPIGSLVFDAYGKLDTTLSTNPLPVNIDLPGVMADLGQPSGAISPLAFNIDFSSTTQFASTSGTNSLDQDGYAPGRLTGLAASPDGIVVARYSNGQTRAQGQVVLSNFANPNGLQSQGNNQWIETAASGVPVVGAPNTSNLGVLQSSAVEESNVDLTGELVKMITFQRNYQASAQSIKTEDQLMQTLVNLR